VSRELCKMVGYKGLAIAGAADYNVRPRCDFHMRLFLKEGVCVKLYLEYLLVLLCPLVSINALATTSNISGADVSADDKTLGYRSSYESNDDSRPSVFSQRLYYQQSVNDRHRNRVVMQHSRTEGGPLELRFTRVEHLWQYQKPTHSGETGALRFELQLVEGDDEPHSARVNWIKGYTLGQFSTRFNFTVGRDFGDDARSGASVAARAQVSRKVGKYGVGLQFFSNMNTTSAMGSFDRQKHQIGPTVSRQFGTLTVFASYLSGLSKRAPDNAFRLYLKCAL